MSIFKCSKIFAPMQVTKHYFVTEHSIDDTNKELKKLGGYVSLERDGVTQRVTPRWTTAPETSYHSALNAANEGVIDPDQLQFWFANRERF